MNTSNKLVEIVVVRSHNPVTSVRKSVEKLMEKPNPSTASCVLTANQLNTEIVRLRAVVRKARVFFIQRLVRRIRWIGDRMARNPRDSLKKKIDRLEEELRVVKTIFLDEFSKFALLSSSTSDHMNISDRTSPKKRCFYKLSCHPRIREAVLYFRSRYPSWEEATSFLLQRRKLRSAAGRKNIFLGRTDEVVNELPNADTERVVEATSNEGKHGKTPGSFIDSDDKEGWKARYHKKQAVVKLIRLHEVGEIGSGEKPNVATEGRLDGNDKDFLSSYDKDGTDVVYSSSEKMNSLHKLGDSSIKRKGSKTPRDDEKAIGRNMSNDTKEILDSYEELHPSWAARRQCRKLQQSTPKGKRIVFSDDVRRHCQ